jgi:hypothetical protein
MTYRKNALKDRDQQATCSTASVDRFSHAKLEQLPSYDNSVLSLCEGMAGT